LPKAVSLPASLRLTSSNTAELQAALNLHKEWTRNWVQVNCKGRRVKKAKIKKYQFDIKVSKLYLNWYGDVLKTIFLFYVKIDLP
jgi:hypothetical protein